MLFSKIKKEFQNSLLGYVLVHWRKKNSEILFSGTHFYFSLYFFFIQECPRDRSKYEQWRDCRLPPCPDPQWTAWSPWSDCSLTCGLGLMRKVRACADAATGAPMQPGFDCIGGGVSLDETCKDRDCPSQCNTWIPIYKTLSRRYRMCHN